MALNTVLRLTTITLLFITAGGGQKVYAQGSITQKSGVISFFSSTPVEDIKAENTSFTSSINPADSSVSFSVPIKGFVFRKRLMQQHFNEQYMESEKFPVANFSGKLEQPIPPLTGGLTTFRTRVTGTLTIRDVSKEIDGEVVIARSSDEMDARCELIIRPADFGIRIPRILVKNIAEEISMTVSVLYSINSER